MQRFVRPRAGNLIGQGWILHRQSLRAPPCRQVKPSPRHPPGPERAVYSLQFEFGPLSEASIGNFGLHPETTGWVDHVVTPVGAFGLMIGEDALDRFFVKGWSGTRPTASGARRGA